MNAQEPATKAASGILKFFGRYRNDFAITAGLAIAAAGYLFVKTRDEIEEPKEVRKQIELPTINIVSNIPVERTNGVLSVDTILEILQAATKVGRKTCEETHLELRRKRRAAKSDLEYVEALEYATAKLQIVGVRAHFEVVDNLKISRKEWQSSLEEWMQRGNLKIQQALSSSLRSSQTVTPEPTKMLSMGECKKILRHQLEYIEDNAEKIRSYIKLATGFDVFGQITVSKIHDDTAEVFSVEKEDIEAACKDFGKEDAEIIAIKNQIQTAIRNEIFEKVDMRTMGSERVGNRLQTSMSNN